MTTINSTNSNSQVYDKKNDVVTKSETKTPEVSEKASSLNNGDKLQTYTVKKGDTLWGISKDKLGNPQKWQNVFELNKDQIKNPDLIYPKQVIKLPIAVPHEPVNPTPEPEKPVDDKPVDNKPPVADNPPHTEPVKPTPQPPVEPSKPDVHVKPKNHLILNSAAVGAAVGATVTAGTLVGITASLAKPLSNLGGYATAQIVAKNLNKIGVSLGSAPEVASLVKSVGGPKAAGAIAVVGVGVAVAGLAAGGAYLYKKYSKE